MDMIPLTSISLSIFLSYTGSSQLNGSDENENNFWHDVLVNYEVLAIVMLWCKAFYYLRIWDATNYLARMVVQVIKDMTAFILIYSLFHLAFG
jgi:hypothetical protein